MVSSGLLKEHGFVEERYEEVQAMLYKASGGYHPSGSRFFDTGFPKPNKRYRMIYEVYDLSIEETYFWILKYLRHDASFPVVDKIEDAFAAAEGSAFFGVAQTRVGLFQDKVSQFLLGIGKMVKELFQLVRELRIIDERTAYYNGAEGELSKPIKERRKSDNITLKGMFIDLVQGGAKSAASVYGMARELEFTTLPDLFFDAPPFRSVEELEEHVRGLQFNESVKRVLIRHLRHFLEWKKRTYIEIQSRRKFTLQYLRQHFDIIKMYMEWIKPYMRHVERLGSRDKHISSPDIIASFEGSMLDIELLAQRPFGGYYACILATFNYRTRPSMKFVQEGYQRGPVHVGKMEMNLRSYVWTKEQVEKYKKMKEKENFELLKTVSGSVTAAMEALGDELFGYLEEAGKEIEKVDRGIEEGKKGALEKLFGDFMNPKKVKSGKKEVKKTETALSSSDKKEAEDFVKNNVFLIYKNFKKSHGMIQW